VNSFGIHCLPCPVVIGQLGPFAFEALVRGSLGEMRDVGCSTYLPWYYYGAYGKGWDVDMRASLIRPCVENFQSIMKIRSR